MRTIQPGQVIVEIACLRARHGRLIGAAALFLFFPLLSQVG